MTDIPKLARIKQDDENMEKLHTAARRGQTELLNRLISTGIDPSIQNKFGCTALHLTCKHGHATATRFMVQVGSNISAAWHGQRPLHLAVQSKNTEVIQVLVNALKEAGKDVASFINENDEYVANEVGHYTKEVHGQTALHLAIALENTAMVHHLLSMGASPTSKDRVGETPIMRAIEFNQIETLRTLMSAPKDSALRLDICDKQGRSSIHWAISHNRVEMAQMLLKANHDVNIEDGEKITPFLLAAYAGMYQLLEQMLPQADQFAFLSANFHNGVSVQPDRMPWLTFASMDEKTEVQKMLQKKLDSINKERGTGQLAGSKAHVPTPAVPTKAPPQATAPPAVMPAPAIQVAPSAPVKK